MKLNLTSGTFNGDLKVDASVGTENAQSIISVSGDVYKRQAGWFAVVGNGNYKTQNSIINITDGELISTAEMCIRDRYIFYYSQLYLI